MAAMSLSSLYASMMLTNPADILNATQPYFPKAKIAKVQDDPLHVELALADGIDPVRITCAVNKLLFGSAIQELLLNRLSVAKSDGSSPTRLDPSRFSENTMQISGWLKYIRTTYTHKVNKTCESFIQEYLASSTVMPVPEGLNLLGLAPDQVEAAEKSADYEDTLKYFKSAIAGLSGSDRRIINLRTRYPHTTDRMDRDIIAKEFAQPREDKYKTFHEQLQRQVIGQSHATQEVASVLVRTKDNKSPVFLFVGPTGVGKTELAKATASLKNNQMIRFDMQQFGGSHSASALFGAPAGYVGSTDKPQLAKEFERYPEAVRWSSDRQQATITGLVILFDEFEKAHPTLRQTFLTLFDEGCCTVQYTEGSKNISIKYILKNCILICTSNLCKDLILEGFRQGLPIKDIKDNFKVGNKRLQVSLHLSPSYSDELLGRMEIVPFGPIPRGESYQRLISMKLDKVLPSIKTEIGCKEVDVEDRPTVLTRLEASLYRDGVDIREVERHYDRIKAMAVKEKGSWGNLSRVKITLRPDDVNVARLSMRIFVHFSLSDVYKRISIIPEYSTIPDYPIT